MSRTHLDSATASQPEVVSAVVERLARLAPDLSREQLVAEASDLLLAALEAIPPYEVLAARRASEAVVTASELEMALPVEEGWRSRTLRVALTALDVLEGAGTDSSAVLSGSAQEMGDALEALVRGARDALSERFDADAFSPATWSPEVVGEVLEASRDWVAHYRSINSVVEDWSLPEPTSEALWEATGWEERYRLVARSLLSSILHPAELDGEEWEEFMYGELEELEEAQEELLARVGDADLAAAGVTRTPDGRFTGLLLVEPAE